MNMLFIKHFFVRFMVSEIPRVSVFGHCRIRILSPSYIVCHYHFIYLVPSGLFYYFILGMYIYIYIYCLLA